MLWMASLVCRILKDCYEAEIPFFILAGAYKGMEISIYLLNGKADNIFQSFSGSLALQGPKLNVQAES
jgi:hypothetical protein